MSKLKEIEEFFKKSGHQKTEILLDEDSEVGAETWVWEEEESE